MGTITIEVLDPRASNMYLGRALTLTSIHATEIEHRLKKAWSKFGANRRTYRQRNTAASEIEAFPFSRDANRFVWMQQLGYDVR